MGLHDPSLRCRFPGQVYPMFRGCKDLWLYIARVECCWCAHGLQRVGSVNSQTRSALTMLVSLVELIVLNVGLQANILDQRIFSMFVLQALVLTFITTPLTILVYPPRYRVHVDTSLEKAVVPGTGPAASSEAFMRSKFTVVLDGMEHLPPAMTLTQLLQPLSLRSNVVETSSIEKASSPESSLITDLPNKCSISVDALRLVGLTDRTSDVLRSQSTDVLIRNDPVLSIFRTFGRLNHFSMIAFLSVISNDEFSVQVVDHARERGSQLIVIPWLLASHMAEASTSDHTAPSYSPFDSLFSSKTSGRDEAASLALRSQFIRRVFASSASDVALFIDRGLSTDQGSTIYPHIFLPFFGGPDDRLALSFVVQLCMHGVVSATVVRIRQLDSDGKESLASTGEKSVPNNEVSLLSIIYDQLLTHGQVSGFPNTVYSPLGTQVRMQSDTADNLLWDRVTSTNSSFSAEVRAAMSRISFRSETAARPLHRMLELANNEASRTSKPLLVVAGRSRRMAVESHKRELQQLITERGASLASEVSNTLGDVASVFVVVGGNVSLVVMQATLS